MKASIKERMNEALTPHHLLGYLLDHRRLQASSDASDDEAPLAGAAANIKKWPEMTPRQCEAARDLVSETDPELDVILAAYETKDTSIFPKVAFSASLCKMSPLKYWSYIKHVCGLQPVKTFCELMINISACQASSAGIERLFSSNGLVHTKLRNRLQNDKVAKIVRVYRHLGWREPEESVDEDCFDDIFM